MRFENVSILSVAHVDAPHRVASEEIEARLAPTLERLGMHSDLLRSLSGIMARSRSLRSAKSSASSAIWRGTPCGQCWSAWKRKAGCLIA